MDNESLNGFTGFATAGNGNFQYTRDVQEQAEPLAFSTEELAGLTSTDTRWAWNEINLRALRHNVMQARNHVQPGVCVMAVVKADAYGHGAVECARAALSAGATWLGVATVDEALQLRNAHIDDPILILAQPPASSIPVLLAHNITPTIYTTEFALLYGETADRHNMVGSYHLAINTGMNRIGVRVEEVLDFFHQTDFHRGLEMEGVFTHFATADSVETIDFQRQLHRFTECVNALRAAGARPRLVHAANSAALFRYPETHFDMVRLGIAMYGYHPCPETRSIANLQPVMSVKARITAVNTVPVGEGVSYGLLYRSPGSVRICTIPLGYADGLRRGLSGQINVILDGQYCPQVGRICMDQCMFEVDLRSSGTRARLDPQVGETVTVVGSDGDAICTVTEMATILDTIEYELLCGFGQRLPRMFLN